MCTVLTQGSKVKILREGEVEGFPIRVQKNTFVGRGGWSLEVAMNCSHSGFNKYTFPGREG